MDDITEEVFNTLESVYRSYAKLDSLMRDGFLSMSRARYHMGGTRSVGALQFEKNEMEMQALSTVNVYSETDDLRDHDDDAPWPDMEVKLVQRQPQKSTKVFLKDKYLSDDNTSLENRLRRRKNVSKDSGDDLANAVNLQDLSLSGKGDKVIGQRSEEGPKLKDPLTLFGVLISPHLRQCQTAFKQATELVVQISNAKHRLQGLQKEYQQLREQKEALSEKS